MTDHPSFLTGSAFRSQAKPDLEHPGAETLPAIPPCPPQSQKGRDGGMSCIKLDKVLEKNLSWHSSLWGSHSHVCLPVAATGSARRKPIVLMSEGIGITPMIAMARFLMEQVHRQVDVHFIHEVRGDKEAPFLPDMYAWGLSPHFTLHIRQPLARRPLRPAMSHGMVDAEFMSTLRTPADADYYVCGSTEFTERSREALNARGVAPSQIHVASIGPAPAAPAFGSPFLKKLDEGQRALYAPAAPAAPSAPRRTGLFAFFFAPFMGARRLGRT
ncbi:hypothetical protein [Kordiimonas gwangyangensis]|uniref:hypothetical protein n=1 Tax=Kordiimonas gwangyangensis TaxID=288022 RepID=UPI0003648FCC|nr:hypothetical protein [Kordiimonas gwangyangensis]